MRASAGRRVLMLLENSGYPQDARVRTEARTLVDNGYEVSVVCPRRRGQRWREDLQGVHVYRYPTAPAVGGHAGFVLEYGVAMVASLILSVRALVARGFDIVHAHNPPDTFVFIAALYKLMGKRFVFDHHDLSPEMYRARFGKKAGGPVYRALLLLERLSLRLADHVIATNCSYRDVALERGGIDRGKVTVVRNGPELDRVRAVPPDSALRSLAPHIIGYVGVLGYQDGVDYLLRALARLVYELGRRDFYCVIVGKGDALEDLRRLAGELGIGDFVRFTGYVTDEELMSYLSSAHICVDPDPFNDFNDRSSMLKMTEYMALGKPIVAFDLTEHRVTAAGAAVYAGPNDELDFARKLVDLMDDPERRSAMGRLGSERVRSHLAWVHQERHLLQAYESVRGISSSAPVSHAGN